MSSDREGLADDRSPTCPFCGRTCHDSERLHDGNLMETAELVDMALDAFLSAPKEYPADLNRPPRFPEDYSEVAQEQQRVRMRAALGVVIRNMPYLAALRQNQSLDAGERMREAETGRLIATGWIIRAGREAGEDRGLTATVLLDMEMQHPAKWSDAWSGRRHEIRECSDQSARALPLSQEGSGC